jgi:hypothetical protein
MDVKASKRIALNRRILTMIGVCLLCVQQAEQVLSGAVENILDRPGSLFTNASEAKQKQTLGELLKRIKGRVKLEYGLKERLFQFVKMRNTFVHDVSAVPG